MRVSVCLVHGHTQARHTGTHAHTRTHTRKHAHTHTRTRTHARTHARTHTRTHTYTHAQAHTHTHIHIRTHKHTHTHKHSCRKSCHVCNESAATCLFQQYQVLFSAPVALAGTVPQGCSGLTAANTLTCTATALPQNASYRFTVSKICTVASTNSLASQPSVALSTLVGVPATNCTLPTFTTSFTGLLAAGFCTPGGVLQKGASCTAACQNGLTLTAGSLAFVCSNATTAAVLTAPTATCTDLDTFVWSCFIEL
jgi:hypothetical protein